MVEGYLRAGGPVLVTPVSRPFDDDFRRLALPHLQLRAAGLAELIAAGYCGFGDASDMLMQEAIRRGGSNVTDLYDLEDYLVTLLADYTDQAFDRSP